MKRLLFLILFLTVGQVAISNNVRISGEPVVQLNATSDSLSLKFTLSWDNSWRDDFNWDAVWLFVKYKREGSQDAWSHLYLSPGQSGNANLEIDPGNTGDKIVGAFVYPKNKGSFNISGEQVTLRAPINGLSAADITDGKIYFAVQAVEMVLIPYGPYYLGDGFSNHTFLVVKDSLYGPIPENLDVVDNKSGYVMTASHIKPGEYLPSNAADHENYNTYSEYYSWDSSLPSGSSWWKIDFNIPRLIRYFGISGPYNYWDSYPRGNWYLQGSTNDRDWITIAQMPASLWRQPFVSYPVQHSIRVSNPGNYRFYRIYFPDSYYAKFQNIAMTEADLFPQLQPGDIRTGYVIDSEQEKKVKVNVQEYTLPAAYPKGYKGFYMMKYELSQEQYVNFLNMLSYAQQKNRIGNTLDHLHRGDYVFGDAARPSCRNGIAVFSHKGSSQPVVFGNNLNPADPFFAADDGQTLACNYLTGPDMLAYLDWSGLRPLSELEYEKACRTPDRSLAGEYAWNTTGLTRLNGQSGLSASTMGTENEIPSELSVNANAGNVGFGPVRCGSFGSSTSNQQQSGASFYGVMELSGNLGEMCYSVLGGSGLNVSSSNNEYHGDGLIASDGNHNVSGYWNGSSTTDMLSIRGGSFASPDSLLRISDRSLLMNYDNSLRDSTVTFRGVRSISKSVDPGEIGTDATCPGLVTINSVRDASCSVDFTYYWYVKRPASSVYELIEGESGAQLTDYEITNSGATETMAYSFQRKVVALTGEAYAELSISVPNMTWKITPAIAEVNICGIMSGQMTARSLISGSTYSWSYNGNILSESSTYTPLKTDFNGLNGEIAMKCRMERSACSSEKTIIVRLPVWNIVSSVSEELNTQCGNVSIRDSRDGQVYCTVRLGEQCWLGQNLNVGEFIRDDRENCHLEGGIQKYCYENNEDNCSVYGGLYTWQEMMSGGQVGVIANEAGLNRVVQGICPDGWHLPTATEFSVLSSHLNGDWYRQLAGYKGKTGNDLYNCNFCDQGIVGRWWTTTYCCNNVDFQHWDMGTTGGLTQNSSWSHDDLGFSVRCIKD